MKLACLYALCIFVVFGVVSIPPFSELATVDHKWLSELKRYQHPDGTPKRPLNSFMCYKITYYDAIKSYLKSNNNIMNNKPVTNGEIAKECGQSWTREPVEIKELYHQISKIANDNHRDLFPAYIYQPTRKQKAYDSEEDAEYEIVSIEEWNAL